MKKMLVCSALAFIFVLGAGYAEDAVEKSSVKLESENAKIGYSIGIRIGQDLSDIKEMIDLEAFMAAIKDVMAEKEPAMTDEAMRDVLMNVQQKMQAAKEAKDAKEAEENLAKGNAFLEENKKQEGVKVTESGLQYKVLKEGDGPKPTAEDTVKVHYKGTFIDGETFDSSYDRGAPAEFKASGLIPGWVEALQMMPVGSKWQLVIPPDLGYGSRGGRIPANSVLVFEMELIEIVK